MKNKTEKNLKCEHNWVFHRADDYGTTQYICTKCKIFKNEKDTNNMIEYVVGFLFNPKMDQVVLINKTHPEWQKGFLNGVGGKIENGEDSYMAMKREFEEEAGLTINDWNHFCSIYGSGWKCNFLYSISDLYRNGTKSMTDEKLQIVNVNNLFNEPVIENLRWLIPMCLDKAHKFCEAETFFK